MTESLCVDHHLILLLLSRTNHMKPDACLHKSNGYVKTYAEFKEKQFGF